MLNLPRAVLGVFPERVLLVGPYGEFVSIQVMEMKASAAGKGKNRFDDPCTDVFEATLRLAQVLGIEDDQRPARIHRAAFGEAASQPPIAELAIGRAIVRKGPAEGLP
jgi:hypothetical protein